jgi:class 3 adenylate cyclase/CHASE2 domain-containing sensor protein
LSLSPYNNSMNTPNLPTFKFLDHWLENRYFQFMFWLMAMGLMVLVGFLLLIRQGTVSNMELSLLDLKMRFRTSYFSGPETTPSKDIVLLALDQQTDKYARLHPELGLSITMPRNRLAKVLNHLTDQGVKAVIFDLEFKDAKVGDEQLAAAIKRNGHVYTAMAANYPLEAFIKDRYQSTMAEEKKDPQYFLEMYLFEGLFRPYLSYLSQMRYQFMPYKGLSALDLGMGPIYQPLKYAPQLVDLWATTFNRKLMVRRALSPVSVLMAPPQSPIPEYGDFMDRAFASLCTIGVYTNFFQNNPDFLKMLENQRLLVDVSSPIPEPVGKNLTHCSMYPVTNKIMNASPRVGITSVDYFEDAYIRSTAVLFKGYKGNFYTYLGLRPVLDILNINSLTYTPGALFLNQRRIPLQEGYKVMINWRNPRLLVQQMLKGSQLWQENDPIQRQQLEAVNPEGRNLLLGGGYIYRNISFIDVLNPLEGRPLQSDEQDRLYQVPYHSNSGAFSFKNKVVIIGNTVTDIHRTPMSNTMAGPEVVAAVLDMFLHDKTFVQKMPPLMQWTLVACIAFGIGMAIITFENLAVGFSIAVVLMLLYWLVNLMSFVYLGYWLEVLLPSLVLSFALIASTLYRYYIHDQEKHHLTGVFAKYVSPQVMSEIVKNPAKALENLKGGKKELTVLFADLQGFTRQFENVDPELMVSQLNEYFDVMTDIILNHDGTYDKYMGDSIMAFFGAPADMPNHAEMACLAALEMQRALHTLNQHWSQTGCKILAHGIGLSSGEMFVGNFGSRKIKNFTVMGSNVNLGARLEAYTRVAHWPIILSEGTWAMVKDKVQARNLGRIQVKGFTAPVQTYGLEGVKERPELQVFPVNPHLLEIPDEPAEETFKG